ncbi:MAG TPA: protein kinase, partial [Blastocatellia bacterium]|nr:protein kinase [Blastocatellia bacterium]
GKGVVVQRAYPKVIRVTPERWQQVKELFQQALELDSDSRAVFLEEACGYDELLRREVELLISGHDQAGSFIETPPYGVAAEVISEKQNWLAAGEVISKYQIVSHLGDGGAGEVYLAQDTQLKRKVAIKVLRTESLKGGSANKLLIREARAAAGLDHPNICAIHEVCEAEDRAFIVMQYVEGETLASRVERKGLEVGEVVDIAIQVADALSEVHSLGITHRDIKPGNIMITPRGRVKVLDFGLAKAVPSGEIPLSQALTQGYLCDSKAIEGTLPYMSPEQLKGEELDARSDLFSLGAVIYEMITTRRPFSAGTAAETIGAILLTQQLPMSIYDQSVPPGLELVVNKLLAKEKSDRYQSAAEVLEDLRHFPEVLGAGKSPRSGQNPVVGQAAVTPTSEISEVPISPRFAGAAGNSSIRKRYSIKTIDSLAVMPLVNASGDSEMEYLSDGITESLINKLALVPKLRVMARASVFRYKGREFDPQQVGRDLKVRAVLTGRVIQRSERLIISVELSDTNDGAHIWGELYNRTSADIFEVEDEISRVISEELRLKLTSSEKRRMTKRYTENPEVYNLYLLGRYHYNKVTGEGMTRATEYYRQAISLEPRHAPAYAGLANTFVTLWWYGFVSPDAVAPARAATTEALGIDERLSDAHIALGRIRQCYDWQWEEAEKEFKRAIKLNPNSSDAHLAYATFLASMCRFDEAQAEGKLTLDLDPLSLSVGLTLGWCLYYFTRDYHAAIEHGRKMLEIEPNFYGAHWLIAASLNLLGEFAESADGHRRALALGGGSHVLAGLGSVYARWGKTEEAIKVIGELEALKTQIYVPAYQTAMVYAFLADRDSAFEWLERSYEERNGTLAFLKTDVAMDNLKDDPRFIDLMQRLDLN